MILSGKTVAETIHTDLKQQIALFSTPPGLAVILIGDHSSSQTYVNMKRRACEKVGIRSFIHYLPSSTSENTLIELVQKFNHDPLVDGILVQLPLPQHIRSHYIIQSIDPRKDVDGFHPENLGKILAGSKEGFIPCTPLGIKVLLDHYQLKIASKHVVIVGRSVIVGKPLAALLITHDATVTIVHSKTLDLSHHTKQADLLIVAVGIAHFIKQDMVKQGAVVIDVGINKQDGKLVGDVDFQQVEKKCMAITPVPGGVGPMTVAMLLSNTVRAYQALHS